jgi:hypothetical protein
MVGTGRNLADMIRDSWKQVYLMKILLRLQKQTVEKTVKFATEYETDIADFHGRIWFRRGSFPQCILGNLKDVDSEVLRGQK